MIDTLKKQSRTTEAAVIGSMILERSAVDVVKGILSLDDFLVTEHRWIVEAIYELSKTVMTQIDLVQIRDWFLSHNRYDAVGGRDFLVTMVESVPSAASAEYYAYQVKDYSTRYRMGMISQELLSKCMIPYGQDAQSLRSGAIDSLVKLPGSIRDGSVSMFEALVDIDTDKRIPYLSTGFATLDDRIIGLGEGQVIVVAGRPGMGKSALMGEMALRLSKDGKKVLFFSMEMTAPDIVMRMVCSEAGVNAKRAITQSFWNDEKERFLKSQMKLGEIQTPIRFICRPLSLPSLQSAVLSAKRRNSVDAVFVDYLGLMTLGKPSRSRYESLTDMSGAIKQLAMETQLPIIVGCQLNRQNEQRANKRPSLGDLRDSGAIEQDADVVMLLHRPGYYDDAQPQEDCEVLVPKNRRAELKSVHLSFNPAYVKFYERENLI